MHPKTYRPRNFFILIIIVSLTILFIPVQKESRATITQEHSRETRLSLSPAETRGPNKVFRISLFKGGEWKEVGSLCFDRFYSTCELEVKVPRSAETIRFRIEKEGGGAAHVDSVLLEGTPPLWTNSPAREKISHTDFDVINAPDKELEVSFSPEALTTKKAIFSLTGRIEKEVLAGWPLQFPMENTSRQIDENARFYRYRLGSNPVSIDVDGVLTEKLGEPFFAEYVPISSGHPQTPTYGWVSNDAENLYVAIDVTADNTIDDNLDYAKVYVKAGNAVKEHRVSMEERKWGTPGFTYTDRVSWQHKVYEFSLPLEGLGIDQADKEKPLELAFAAYGTLESNWVNRNPVLLFDSSHNSYFAAYEHLAVDDLSAIQIHCRLIDINGNAIGPSIPVTTTANSKYNPSAASDAANSRHLVVWVDNNDIYGQLVNSDGTLYSGNFPICTNASTQNNPTVAFDQNNSRFLVVWGDYRNGNYDIYGQLVNADGTLYDQDGDETPEPDDDNFAICTETLTDYNPSVAFDENNSRFLVAWRDFRSENNDIYGQLVNADGTLYSGNFAICTAAGDQDFPSVVFDTDNSRFLVAWQDNYDIYGQLVNADGTLYSANFEICTNTAVQNYPSVAFDASAGRFLVAWQDQRDGYKIYGQLVNADGTLYGYDPDGGAIPATVAENNFSVYTSSNSQYAPFVVSNAYHGGFLSVCHEREQDTMLYYLLLTRLGSLAPPNTMLSFPPQYRGGVASGSSAGDSFEFQVVYWGTDLPSNTALWIDLNGDGTYANAPPFSLPFFPDDPRLKIPVLMLIAAMAFLTALLTIRKKRPAVYLAILLLVALAAGFAIPGCAGGGGAPGEIQFMAEADSGDTDCTDGKTYTVSFSIGSSGSYSYRFAFTDEEGSPVLEGIPVQENSLTVK